MGVNSDYMRLTLFPFSLLREAKRWLNSELANSITTWDDLTRKFLIRVFPSGKTAKLRSDILSFRQKGGKNLYQAWDRFKFLLLSCPHHHQANEVLVHTFIEGLEPNTKVLLDSVAGGQALEKTYAELFTLLNRISQGNPKWNGGGAKSVVQKTTGVLEIDTVTALSAQIAAMQNMMTTYFSNMSLGQQQAQVYVVHQPQAWCEVCGGGDHRAKVCGANPDSVHFNQYRPQSSGQQYHQQSHENQQNHDNQQAAKQSDMSVEDMLKQIMADQAKLAADGLSGNIDSNPKQVNVVSTRSGRPLEELTPKEKVAQEKGTHVDEAKSSEQRVNEEPKVHVNLPLIDVLQGIPKYAKYVKDVVANKNRLTEYATVTLTEECISRIQNRLPIKLKDPRSFTVQIQIGKCVEARGLCDLGASINLMPTSMFLKLGLGKPNPTTIMLQLADRSMSRPDGVIEDILVQVGTLIFPVDFVILDFELDPNVPFILGRLFLAIGGALIDVAASRLIMRAHEKVEVFVVYKAMKLPAIYEELSAITVIDKAMASKYVEAQDPLEKVLIMQDIEGDIVAQELVNVLNVPNVSMLRKFVEPLNRVLRSPPKPSIEEAPKLELKALPSHIRLRRL
ncbi:uncharacterized protein [Solanum tuberosum]|uniref:uncharacterized protein n=1 Tax=Solanum tuberosum TaxID=4113 RepID=UPI00073A3CC8|nr:PREDICTED: uncharacterized protein LOC107062518 [Solanum tuberosum]